jgi:hypothetical protein
MPMGTSSSVEAPAPALQQHAQQIIIAIMMGPPMDAVQHRVIYTMEEGIISF